ncbi:MAG: hypothetical protein C0483_00625 [Pirellula sp.]|nr:hypothetical protein [Pirellula sp.]
MTSATFVLALALVAAPVEMPRVVDDRLQLELILQEPDIVTPTGLTIDTRGRILVIESHTHFRPDGYQGPPHDRILLIDPAQKPYKPTVFFEGSKYTMSVAKAPDDSIYVATRSEIFRLRDLNGDDKCDQPEERTPIAHLETSGNYPHNGLSGFAFGPFPGKKELPGIRDEVYFGFGENLGADYKLVGSDGKSLAGGGEGGNIYACSYDGKNVRRVATGFWNPFHVTFNRLGQLFTVDNDPDSRPPCRLIHVVEGGDYGYRFRNGRKGTHPFTAWNGELPGTLPMVAGTGEAPCAVICTNMLENLLGDERDEPKDLHSTSFNDLLVTSWGDHRIERYRLNQRGKSYVAAMEPVVVGGENFRPVGMAEAPDGSIYFSDWVDRSYPLHGKGRIWRLSKKPQLVERHSGIDVVIRAGALTTTTIIDVAEIRGRHRAEFAELAKSKIDDPFAWQAASHGLTEFLVDQPVLDGISAKALLKDFAPAGDANQTIWAAVGARDAHAENAKVLAPLLLAHADPRVRLLGVVWAGEEGMTEQRGAIVAGLSRSGMSRQLFEASLAALEMLDAAGDPAKAGVKRDPKKEPTGEQYALRLLLDAKAAPEVRTFALKALRPDCPELTTDALVELAGKAEASLSKEIIRTLRERADAAARKFVREVAADDQRAAAYRTEALAGLSPDDSADRKVLEQLAASSAKSSDGELQAAARRVLDPPALRETSLRAEEISAGGDPAAGEGLFFHPRVASCYRCHEYEGRGAAVGPALTTFGRGASRERILQSILEPSKEIAPHYVPWILTTTDGRTLTGLFIGEEVDGTQRFVDAQGKLFKLHPREIESREAAKQSIMPADFGRTLTETELRDLAAFLLQPAK